MFAIICVLDVMHRHVYTEMYTHATYTIYLLAIMRLFDHLIMSMSSFVAMRSPLLQLNLSRETLIVPWTVVRNRRFSGPLRSPCKHKIFTETWNNSNENRRQQQQLQDKDWSEHGIQPNMDKISKCPVSSLLPVRMQVPNLSEFALPDVVIDHTCGCSCSNSILITAAVGRYTPIRIQLGIWTLHHWDHVNFMDFWWGWAAKKKVCVVCMLFAI